MKFNLCLASLILIFCVTHFDLIECQALTENQDKIIGLKHFEEFLRDLEKKIAEWTKTFRETVAGSGVTLRIKRQSEGDYVDGTGKRPIKVTDWLIVQDILEGTKFIRKQVTDFIDRATRFITGDQMFRQAANNGPYVPIVKEMREFLDLLQRRLTIWSNEIDRLFRPRPTNDSSQLALR